MARLTFSPLIAGMSGKTADAVTASWKGRAYVRKRVIPANPNTAAQQTVRDSMGRLSPLWRSLESQIKAVQDDYAVNEALSGWNWFVRSNRVLEETYESGLITPPNTDIEAPASITLTDQGGGTCKVDWTGGTQGAGYYIYVVSRKIETGEVVNAYVVQSSETVLVSALTTNVSLAASKDFLVAIAVEDTANSLFSASVYDTVSLGA